MGNYPTALRPETKNRAGLASHPPANLEEVALASASTPITASTSTSASTCLHRKKSGVQPNGL
ncbi:hypothetical protein PM082_000697 [Marasmius tenuissimus]|nr:hypothetical protein PM082_000697 [Marasmius tenuissimus]